ncbi:MAG TPA: hypothetical protein VJX67_13510, partial [Blastocatellia bacterium]|nr:hypothetical protein [Blastocatellia bacterium]
MVTGSTLHKEHLFLGPERLTLLENTLLSLAKQAGWQLEAWAVFTNHYHLIGQGMNGATDLKELLKRLHVNTARDLNVLDGTSGRRVWYNFWDTKLTYEQSYLARLAYVHRNPVKHGLVTVANQYR